MNPTMSIKFGQTVTITVTGADNTGAAKPVTNIHIVSLATPSTLTVAPISGQPTKFTAIMPLNADGTNIINWAATNELGTQITGTTNVTMSAVIPATTLATAYV